MIPGLYKNFQDKWGKYQTIWIISDTHFNDKELAEGISTRPAAEDFVKRINAKVGRKDLLIHLGDVGDVEYVKQIRCDKVLVMGNHDSGVINYKRQYTGRTFDDTKYTKEQAMEIMRQNYPGWSLSIYHECDVQHAPFTYWYISGNNNLFDEVYEGPIIIGEKLILSHEPVNIPWAMNLHGHVHDLSIKDDETHINLCADAINYEPVNLNQLMKKGITAHIKSLHRTVIERRNVTLERRNDKNE